MHRVMLLALFGLMVAGGVAGQSIYTESVGLGAMESVLVDCPPGMLAAYYYQPHERDVAADRSNVVVVCGPGAMLGPIYVEGEPRWYLQPLSPLTATTAPDDVFIFLPLIGG